ncbi:hypothetical protein PR048_009572 [Dryococelus australis]|uniref:Uncharacterized protein n=1 Tax=Dryococelus australis TaxID=614101 RepID=A0ABQ9I1B6_9NEOP|nr:hypothetical protein PR048_009572 [Dryococelus australis]
MQTFMEKHVAGSSVCEMRVQKQLELYDEDLEQHEHDRESFEKTYYEIVGRISSKKHHYLLSSVSDEAHKIIEGLPITANNFEVSWGVLCKTYHNPKLIVTAHVRQLLSLPVVNRYSASDLRNLLSQVTSNLKAIEYLELKIPLLEVLLSQLVLDRLDEQDRKEWEGRS